VNAISCPQQGVESRDERGSLLTGEPRAERDRARSPTMGHPTPQPVPCGGVWPSLLGNQPPVYRV
jgi:hypothetical protein